MVNKLSRSSYAKRATVAALTAPLFVPARVLGREGRFRRASRLRWHRLGWDSLGRRDCTTLTRVFWQSLMCSVSAATLVNGGILL